MERDKNSTSHLCRGVQFRLSLMVTHFSRTEHFHSASNKAIFCIPLSKPRPSPSPLSPPCFHAPVEVCRDGWLEVAEIWRLKIALQGDGFVATSLCTCAINKYTAFMSYKYSDSVSSCCGLQRSPNWSDERARGKKQWEWLIPKMFIINPILLACCRTYNMKSK